MSTDRNQLVWEHMKHAATVMDAALVSLGEQFGEEALRRASAAIKAGSMMQIVTTLSLAGTKGLSFNLIGPGGESFNIGRVVFDGEATLN